MMRYVVNTPDETHDLSAAREAWRLAWRCYRRAKSAPPPNTFPPAVRLYCDAAEVATMWAGHEVGYEVRPGRVAFPQVDIRTRINEAKWGRPPKQSRHTDVARFQAAALAPRVLDLIASRRTRPLCVLIRAEWKHPRTPPSCTSDTWEPLDYDAMIGGVS